MIFTETELGGAYLIDIEPREDSRGFFARTFCQREFEEHGLKPAIAQSSVAFNRHRGTVRGMHFQFPPYAETKLVRVTRGSLLDVIVDLRPESPTYLRHFSVELSWESRRALYVPERFAHGYQTLEDGTETLYDITPFYQPGTEGGLSPLDPALKIAWPCPLTEIAPKDLAWPALATNESELRRRMSL